MNLIKECKDIVFGGVASLKYIPVEDVESIPLPMGDNGELLSSLVLTSGSSWNIVETEKDSFDFSETPQSSDQGVLYEQTVDCFFPKDNPEIRSILREMNKRKFVLELLDNNQNKCLVGTKDSPCSFTSRFVTGTRFSDTPGHFLSFSCASISPALVLKV